MNVRRDSAKLSIELDIMLNLTQEFNSSSCLNVPNIVDVSLVIELSLPGGREGVPVKPVQWNGLQ